MHCTELKSTTVIERKAYAPDAKDDYQFETKLGAADMSFELAKEKHQDHSI